MVYDTIDSDISYESHTLKAKRLLPRTISESMSELEVEASLTANTTTTYTDAVSRARDAATLMIRESGAVTPTIRNEPSIRNQIYKLQIRNASIGSVVVH